MTYPNTLGGRIRFRRNELNMNLEDIARRIGCATSTVQRYEQDSILRIKLPVVESIAKALDVSPGWLLCKTDEMQPEIKKEPAPGQGGEPAVNMDSFSATKRELIDRIMSMDDSTLRWLLDTLDRIQGSV